MSKEFLTSDIRTRLGSLTLHLFDERDTPTSVSLSAPVETPTEIRYGDSRSSGFGDLVVGSYVDLSFPDPNDRLKNIFGDAFEGQFDEKNFRVLIEGQIRDAPFRWNGRIQQSQIKKPINERLQKKRFSLRAYDRLGALRNFTPIERPDALPFNDVLARLLFPALNQIDILYSVDAEGANIFNGSTIPLSEWRPTTKRPFDGDVGVDPESRGEEQKEREEFGVRGDSLRKQLENFASRLGLRVWQEPFTGAWHVVHRPQIGEEVTGATRIESNGFPDDGDFTVTQGVTIPKLEVELEQKKLRSEQEDQFDTIKGLREIRADTDQSTGVKNRTFKVYKYLNSGDSQSEDYRINPAFWDVRSGHVYRLPPALGFSNDLIPNLREWVSISRLRSDGTGEIYQQMPEVPGQDVPIQAVAVWQAFPTHPDNVGKQFFEISVEFRGGDGSSSIVSSQENDPGVWSAGGNTPRGPEVYSLSTSARQKAGRYLIRVSGELIEFRLVNFFYSVGEGAETNKFPISTLSITPEGDVPGRATEEMQEGSFYHIDPLDRLGPVQNREGFGAALEPYKERDVDTVLPIDYSSARYGRDYGRLIFYRASNRLAQQPAGLQKLSTTVIPEVLTPGRPVLYDGQKYVFSGGRTITLKSDDTDGLTDLDDLRLPEIITDPIDPSGVPDAPSIQFEGSWATYDLSSSASEIEGYRLFRRNAPGASGNQVEDDATSSGSYTMDADNPVPALNLHTAAVYNSNGESPKSREVLQTPDGWYSPGDIILDLSAAPYTFTDAAEIIYDAEMYFFGGDGGSGPIATAYKYDPWSDTWTQLTDMPVALKGAAVAEIDNYLMVVGGDDGNGPTTTTLLYDYSNDSWLQTPSALPSARAYGTFARSDVQGYYMGGEDTNGDATATVYSYKFDGDDWLQLSDMPVAQSRHAAATFPRSARNDIFIAGGTEYPKRTYIYDPANVNYERQGDLNVGAWDLSMARLPGTSDYYVAGGQNSGGLVSELQGFAKGSATWDTLTNVPTPREGLSVAAVNPPVLFAIGGDDGGGVTSVHETWVFAHGSVEPKSGDNAEPTILAGNYVVSIAEIEEENTSPSITAGNYVVSIDEIEEENTAPTWTLDNYVYAK